MVDEHAVLHVEDLLDEQLEPLLQQPGRPSGFFFQSSSSCCGSGSGVIIRVRSEQPDHKISVSYVPSELFLILANNWSKKNSHIATYFNSVD